MSVTLTVRLDEASKVQLEMLARSTHRTKGWLAAQAINTYLEQEVAQIKAIEEGIKEANSPNAVWYSNEEVVTWLNSWGSPQETPAPCQ